MLSDLSFSSSNCLLSRAIWLYSDLTDISRSGAIRLRRAAPDRSAASVDTSPRIRPITMRADTILAPSPGSRPGAHRSFSNCASSVCNKGTVLTLRRSSLVSSSTAVSLLRHLPNRDFHEPASLRAVTSAQRNSSTRASAASARACSRSARARSRCNSVSKSHGSCSGRGAGENRIPPSVSTGVRSVAISASRTAMRRTIAHGFPCYQSPFPDLDRSGSRSGVRFSTARRNIYGQSGPP